MLKKTLKTLLSVVLVFTVLSTTCTNAFAASILKKEYIKEMYVSYGKTADEAKKYLTDNGYEVLDNDLNEGADDLISTKRAVYLGYKTTDKSDEAITDIKLMNMKGGYSSQDYKMLLSQQKETLQKFIDSFKVAVNEYRTNYNNKQERAITVHDLLNTMYDDDTKQKIGDLLLNKIKEEYTDEEWNALSAEEQAKSADMTTILMQANSNAVVAIEQLVALATGTNDTPWVERYNSAKTYDEMLEEVMKKNKVDLNQAAKLLAAEYDEDAKSIANNISGYKDYLTTYTDADIKFTNTQEEIDAYTKEHEDFDSAEWFNVGTQYVILSTLTNDDISLLDLLTSDDFDPVNDDRIYLYPLVSILSEGQRACLQYLPLQQLVLLGVNDNEMSKSAAQTMKISSGELLDDVSIYDGVDRTIFDEGNVAMTNEALRLQASTGNNPASSWSDPISLTSLILYGVTAVSGIMTLSLWLNTSRAQEYGWSAYSKAMNASNAARSAQANYGIQLKNAREAGDIALAEKKYDLVLKEKDNVKSCLRKARFFDNFDTYYRAACIAMTCITFVLLCVSAWHTWKDLQAYYNATFTPIPMHMIDQAVNDKDEKVYTYYDAVKCNRVASNLVSDNSKILEEYADLNGDVGKQWVALYTTKDKAAGNPITTNLLVQYNNTKIPDDTAPLSMFGESVAQNLTNKKMGYTYADGKSGIYLFYGSDSSIFAGSVFSNGIYALSAAGAVAIIAVAAVIIRKNTKKRKNTEVTANA